MPAATAAAEPLLEPPGVWAVLCGLRVGPGAVTANSAVTVFPATSAPAARSRSTRGACGPASTSGGTADPALVSIPSIRTMSLTPTITPDSTPGGASAASAASRPRRSGSRTNALIRASSRSIRSQVRATRSVTAATLRRKAPPFPGHGVIAPPAGARGRGGRARGSGGVRGYAPSRTTQTPHRCEIRHVPVSRGCSHAPGVNPRHAYVTPVATRGLRRQGDGTIY